jgi:hypothetical protein
LEIEKQIREDLSKLSDLETQINTLNVEKDEIKIKYEEKNE